MITNSDSQVSMMSEHSPVITEQSFCPLQAIEKENKAYIFSTCNVVHSTQFLNLHHGFLRLRTAITA